MLTMIGRRIKMASVSFEGLIPDSDPRYQEGLSIMIPLGFSGKSKPKSKKVKTKLQKPPKEKI